MSFFHLPRRRFLCVAAAAATLSGISSVKAQPGLLQGGWLELERWEGSAILTPINQGPLQTGVGSRLKQAGDSFETGSNANAVLKVDDGIGRIYISENTKIQIRSIGITKVGGRFTEIQILKGQARLNLRKFANPGSRFIVQSSAGITEVRGTEFGVSVQPDGKMGVATESGVVEVKAEGESVEVNAQEQTLVIIGEPPQPARPLMDNTNLVMELAELSGNELHLVGQIDPVNLLTLDNISQATNSFGAFDIRIQVSTEKTMVVLQVTTPLGAYKAYRIPLFRRNPAILPNFPIPTDAKGR